MPDFGVTKKDASELFAIDVELFKAWLNAVIHSRIAVRFTTSGNSSWRSLIGSVEAMVPLLELGEHLNDSRR